MLYREIIAVLRSTQNINTVCGQNVEFVTAKSGGTYSSHWALKDVRWTYVISLRKMSFPSIDPFFITKNTRPISIKFSITSPHIKESLCYCFGLLRTPYELFLVHLNQTIDFYN
jgi:hypothetical protein